MRRVRDGLFREWFLALLAAINHQIPIADSRPEFDRRTSERSLDRFHQGASLGIRDVTRGKVGKLTLQNRHEIASDRPVVRPKLDAHRRGLKRCPPRVVLVRVVPQQAERRHVAGRQEPVRDVPRPADNPRGGNPIHLRNPRRLKRGPIPKLRNRLVCCPVGYHDDKLGAGHG